VARKIADVGGRSPQGASGGRHRSGAGLDRGQREGTALRRVASGALVGCASTRSRPSAAGKVGAINAAANSQYALLPSGNPSGQFIKVTQRVAVRIELEERDPLLRAGMMAVVDIRAQ
jgi:multidrug resistance efflux pump